jgi:hypothetical protein
LHYGKENSFSPALHFQTFCVANPASYEIPTVSPSSGIQVLVQVTTQLLLDVLRMRLFLYAPLRPLYLIFTFTLT